ncbi:MAG: DUF488 family protein [Candidatus Diapherotrites archaeon]|nr:DUF488 family protein [Candidatus Diapherotrites archaeon]
MYNRQKVLLYLILQLSKLNGRTTKTFLDKILFLLKKETTIDAVVKFYNFYPHNYGPFSNQYYFDLTDLQNQTYLDKNLELEKPVNEIEGLLSQKEKQLVNEIVNKYGHYSTTRIVDYVYAAYPAYAERSVLKTSTKQYYTPCVFSIGYEKKDIDSFLDLLIQNHIEFVIDLRANPFSMNFVFTKNKLTHYLEKAGIQYLHIPELGINGEYRKDLKTDADYKELFEFYSKGILPKQINQVKTIMELGRKKRIALLCFEQDKNHCHRGIVSNELEKQGISVTHI